MLHALSALVLVAITSSLTSNLAAAGAPLEPGDRAPDFDGVTDRGEFSLREFRDAHPGTKLVIVFARAKW